MPFVMERKPTKTTSGKPRKGAGKAVKKAAAKPAKKGTKKAIKGQRRRNPATKRQAETATAAGHKPKPRKSTLSRAIHPMPAFVRRALSEHGLLEAYKARPPFQRNDYVGWISRGAREETQHKRLAQMLDELKRGGVYMKMAWHPTR